MMSKNLKMSLSSCHHLYSLIDDILDLTKLESDTFQLNLEWINIRDTINEIFDTLEFHCQLKNIKFIKELDSSIPDMILIDKKRLRSILFNLLTNGIKYTD